VDREVERLLEQLDTGRDNGEVNGLFDELSQPDEPWAAIDSIVWSLSGGDIVKGREIVETMTMTFGLEWLVMAQNMRE